MSLAVQKFQQSVAEYILFLWQMEDLVRAVYFDTEALRDFIRSYTPDDSAFNAEKEWFDRLVATMRREGVEQKGHVTEVHELIFELNYLHNTLLNILKEKEYIELYRIAQPNMEEYKNKADGKITNDVEICLTALYGLLMLRLKKEPVSNETAEAMKTFSDLLARLSYHYKMMKQGEVNYSLN
ncbi:MAG TPA: DUF4924 family protein [Flavobacteriales bacterium]